MGKRTYHGARSTVQGRRLVAVERIDPTDSVARERAADDPRIRWRARMIPERPAKDHPGVAALLDLTFQFESPRQFGQLDAGTTAVKDPRLDRPPSRTPSTSNSQPPPSADTPVTRGIGNQSERWTRRHLCTSSSGPDPKGSILPLLSIPKDLFARFHVFLLSGEQEIVLISSTLSG